MPFANGNAGGIHRQIRFNIEHSKARVFHRVVGHTGNDTHAKAKLDVGFDHIRIQCGNGHIQCQTQLAESFVNLDSSGETLLIGHDRVFSNILQSRLGQFQQWVALLHNNLVLPLVIRE